MNEVGGAIDRVDDPGRLVSEDAGSAGRYRLFTDEPAASQTEKTATSVVVYCTK